MPKHKAIQVHERRWKEENPFIRVGVKGGGCSGLMYELKFDNILNENDKSFVDNGIHGCCR
jgi:iron-sulfur cluster assembly protein